MMTLNKTLIVMMEECGELTRACSKVVRHGTDGKPKYRDNPDGAETFEIKQQLLDLAILRDNMGEACWYIYTGIFTIFLVQYNLISHRCSVDPKVMDAKFKEFEEKKKQEEEQKKKENTTTYVME